MVRSSSSSSCRGEDHWPFLSLSLPGFISTIIAGITIDSHSDAEDGGKVWVRVWALLSRKMMSAARPVIPKSPISRRLYAIVIVVRSKISVKDCFPLQCSRDSITARKFNRGGLAKLDATWGPVRRVSFSEFQLHWKPLIK